MGSEPRWGKESPRGPLARLPPAVLATVAGLGRRGAVSTVVPSPSPHPPTLHPARPPARGPSRRSLPPALQSLLALPPSRPAQPPPAGTCVSSAISPFSRSPRLRSPPPARRPSAGAPRRRSLGAARPPWNPSDSARPAATPAPFSAQAPPPPARPPARPPSHLVFASRPPTLPLAAARRVGEPCASPRPPARPPGPACPGAEVSHGRARGGGGRRAPRREGGRGRRAGDGGPRRAGGRAAARTDREPSSTSTSPFGGAELQAPLAWSPPLSRREKAAWQGVGTRVPPEPWDGEGSARPPSRGVAGRVTEPERQTSGPQVRRWRRFLGRGETSKSLPEWGN